MSIFFIDSVFLNKLYIQTVKLWFYGVLIGYPLNFDEKFHVGLNFKVQFVKNP